MMTERLLQLTEHPSYALTDWREISKEIDREFPLATTVEQRDSLLAMLKATMNIAETTVAPEDLTAFQEDV